MKTREICRVCYETVCINGCLTCMPVLCCETRKMKAISHRKRGK